MKVIFKFKKMNSENKFKTQIFHMWPTFSNSKVQNKTRWK